MKIIVSVIIFMMVHISMKAQHIVSVPNPNSGSLSTPLIQFNDRLCFLYFPDSSTYLKTELGQFDNNKITIVPRKDSTQIILDNSIVYDSSLYFLTADNYITRLAKYDGQTITTFSNPDSGFGFGRAFPAIYKGNVLYQYNNEEGKGKLAKFNGSTISLIASPDTGDGYGGAYKPILYNNSFFFPYSTTSFISQVARYNDTSISLIPFPSNRCSLEEEYGFIEYNNELYFIVMVSNGEYQLAKCDGNNITLIGNPDAGYFGGFVVYANNLYFLYMNTNQQNQLAKYDGNSISFISNPDSGHGVEYDSYGFVTYDNSLYFKYTNENHITHLARFDGSVIKLIDNVDDNGSIALEPLKVYNNTLYLTYFSKTGYYHFQVGKYQGAGITLYENPDIDGNAGEGNFVPYNNTLYFYYYGAHKSTLGFISEAIDTISLCPPLAAAFIKSDIKGSSYQWQVNTDTVFLDINKADVRFLGTNDSILTFPSPSSWYGYNFRCIVDGKSSDIHTLRFIDTWTGAIDSTWENSANWSCGSLPDANTDVYINSGTVVLGSNATVRSLTVNPNASFTIKTPFVLTITH